MAAAPIIVFLRPNLPADHPEKRPPIAVPPVYVEATAPNLDGEHDMLRATVRNAAYLSKLHHRLFPQTYRY